MNAVPFGRALRRHRDACGLSVRALAAKLHYSKSHISDLENAVRLPHRTLAAALDEVLGAGGELVGLLPGPTCPAEAQSFAPPTTDHLTGDVLLSGDGELEAMKRRTLLGLGSVAGLGIVAPGITSETLRRGVTQHLAEERAQRAVGAWGEIVTAYGYRYNRSGPTEMLSTLVVDLLAIQAATQRQLPAADLRELRRIATYLAGFMAMALTDLGQLVQARRWWRSARHVAEDSGDVHAILWVRGREIVRGMYEHVPADATLRLVSDAERYNGATVPATAMVELCYGKAQALALAGHRQRAVEMLTFCQDSIFPALPAGVTADHGSLFGWPEQRLRFTESFVHSFLGEAELAEEAQTRAIALYPESDKRGAALIELQRALCLVKQGDVVTGVGHAYSTMTELAAAYHNSVVLGLGQHVVDAVPVTDRRGGVVADFVDYLAARAAHPDRVTAGGVGGAEG